MNKRIDNRNTVAIIAYWFNKSESEKEYFYKFICLWISFNAFFVSKFFDDAKEFSKNKEPSERDYLDVIEKNKFCRLEFEEIYRKHKNLFEDFQYVIENKKWCPGIIIDMRPSHRDNIKGKDYKRCDSLSEYLDCVYQIRCNLFHGNKSPSDDNDLNLVETAYKSFKVFIEQIYETERIILDQL